MLGAQIGDQLGDLLVGERVGKGRHLLAAVEDLIGDLGWGPQLVLAQVNERGSLLCADSANAVAVGATFVAKQERSGFFGGLGPRLTPSSEDVLSGQCDEKQNSGQKDRGA